MAAPSAAMLCLLALAGAAAALAGAAGPPDQPVCLGSAEECASAVEPEDGSLLQVHRSPSAREQQSPIGPGCPNSLTWGIIEAAARTVFNSQVTQDIPVNANHTWDDQAFSYRGCNGTLSAFANMSVDVDLSLDTLKCVEATCLKKTWLGCTEYTPLTISMSLSATTLNFKAYADGSASWGAGCKYGSGSGTLNHGKTSFTLTNPAVAGTGTIDLIVSPPTMSSPNITGVTIGYQAIENFECSLDGQPFPACMDATSYLNTNEFKDAMHEAIKERLAEVNDVLGELELSMGTSFEQLAAGKAEAHTAHEILAAMELKRRERRPSAAE